MEEKENVIVFEGLNQLVYFGIQPRNILPVIKLWCKEMLGMFNNWFMNSTISRMF